MHTNAAHLSSFVSSYLSSCFDNLQIELMLESAIHMDTETQREQKQHIVEEVDGEIRHLPLHCSDTTVLKEHMQHEGYRLLREHMLQCFAIQEHGERQYE